MSATALDTFETTIRKTNKWIDELMQIMGLKKDKHKAYSALRAVLHALRDRLTVEEVAQFGAQLPMLIRGFYYEGWDPTAKPLKLRHKEEFLTRIEQEFRGDDGKDAERVARAVFTLLANRVSEGEIEDIKATLPTEIRELWPGP
jgi:uncharacterized protein (DUF2267 family)